MEKEYSRIDSIKKANSKRVYKKFKLTEEQRLKISKALKGRKKSEEHIRKHSESLKGHRHTEATKNKMSKSKIGRKLSEDTKKKLADACKLRWRRGVYDTLRKNV